MALFVSSVSVPYVAEAAELPALIQTAEEDADDDDLVEIPLDQYGAEVGGFVNPANARAMNGFTRYTTNGDISVVFKMLKEDVSGCDYILIKFANPTPSGLKVAFWDNNNATTDLPSGVTEYKYEWSKDPNSRVENDVIPEITMLSMWADNISVDLIGVYKHKAPTSSSTGTDSPNGTDEPAPVQYTAPTIEDCEVISMSETPVNGFTMCTKVNSSNYVTFTATDGLQFAFKNEHVDVTGCDKVIVKFAETVQGNWHIAYKGNQDMTSVAGMDEFVIDIPAGTTEIPEVTLMTGWGAGGTVKVSGVYKHKSNKTEEEIAAQALANAKSAKLTSLNALPVGNGVFQYPEENVNAAIQAVEAAGTVEAVDAVEIPAVTVPNEKQAYQLTTAGGNYLTITSDGVKVSAVQSKIYFRQNYNGKYIISNGRNEVTDESNDGWSLITSTNTYTAYEIIPVTGGITIKTANGFFGFDADADEASIYRNKTATVFGVLEYVEPVIGELTVTDGVATAESKTEKDITYVREFKVANKWQSLYLPFSVNLKDNTADVVLAKVDDVVEVNGELVINIVKVSTTETVNAKTPLFIAAKTVGVKNIKTGVSTVASPSDGNNKYSVAEFEGILSEASAGKAGKYVMSGGELCLVPQSMNNLTLGVNRWAMFVSNENGAKIRINTDGFSADEATAIANAVVESVDNGEIFSINGAKAKNAKSGLYIKGGKKVYVK